MRRRRTPNDLTPRERQILARLIWAFIRAGWNPPPPSDAVADRLLADMGETGGVPLRRTGRDKRLPGNATLELGRRERQCLERVAVGLTYAEIGDELGISQETAKMNLQRAYRKLGARNAAHAVAIWLRREAAIERAA